MRARAGLVATLLLTLACSSGSPAGASGGPIQGEAGGSGGSGEHAGGSGGVSTGGTGARGVSTGGGGMGGSGPAGGTGGSTDVGGGDVPDAGVADAPSIQPDATELAADLSPPAETSLHWVAYGDTRTNASTHQKIVDAFARLDPQLVVHSGDLWDMYGGGSAQWSGIITKNANLGALLEKNLFLVSQGNHESPAELLAFKPTLVRGNSTEYALTMGDSYFVVLGMDPSTAGAVSYLRQQLASPAAKAARWRFVFSHYPPYSGGNHPNNGYPALEQACDDGGVTLFISGHDHNYQRTYQLRGQKPVDLGDALTASKGTVYLVSGGGGAPLYSVKKIANTKVVNSIENFIELSSSASQVDVKVWDINGRMIDTFTVAR